MSATIQVSEFDDFFHEVHGNRPFSWQRDLAALMCSGDSRPELLDLPTGTGKTACIDIALFHLAYEISNGIPRTAPLRIVWAVDRRIVVDEAYDRARALRQHLDEAKSASVSAKVAGALSSMAGDNAPPLSIYRLRGGMPREGDWARTPTQPTILLTTVDQLGSRLLFRGYGISPRMRPIHAGLLGEDALLFLDEVHLSEPFRQTLDAVSRFREHSTGATPWGVIQLSATPAATVGRRIFRLGALDPERDNALRARLNACKPTTLVRRAKIDPGSREHAVLFATEVADRIQSFGRPCAALVVVNRVALAGTVHELLREEFDRRNIAGEVTKLIGRVRPIERQDVVAQITERCASKPERAPLKQSFAVVSTQCIEAGADLDFDLLVTQTASLDALRQRFGRLNRMGRPIDARGAIIAVDAEVRASAEADPIYGEAHANAWNMLEALAAGEGNSVDFSSTAMDAALAGFTADEMASAQTPRLDAPVLMREHLNALTCTHPEPRWSPTPSLYLHGRRDAPPDVNVVWRADLPDASSERNEEQARERVEALLTLLPPRVSEAMGLPIGTVTSWLRGDPPKPIADVATEAEPDIVGGQGANSRYCWRFNADGTVDILRKAADIRPGDTIVVPASYGGCDAYGWNPQSGAVMDLGTPASLPYAVRVFGLRLHKLLLAQHQSLAEQEGEPTEVWAKIQSVLTSEPSIGELLDRLLSISGLPATWTEALHALKRSKAAVRIEYPYGEPGDVTHGIVLFAPRGVNIEDSEFELLESATEADEIAVRGPEKNGQTLIDHLASVRQYAATFAQRLGLAPGIAADIALAGYLHDLGKSDARFQTYLTGDPWYHGNVLAKSGTRRSRVDDRAALQLSGLPRKWRHEALSVRIAREHSDFQHANDPELVLWLIGCHHGFGRPAFPHEEPRDEERRQYGGFVPHEQRPLTVGPSAGPQRIDFAFQSPVDGVWTDWQTMFSRLQSRYGIWGLAFYESIVRLADHRASEASNLRLESIGVKA